jgi:hypothetical protein
VERQRRGPEERQLPQAVLPPVALLPVVPQREAPPLVQVGQPVPEQEPEQHPDQHQPEPKLPAPPTVVKSEPAPTEAAPTFTMPSAAWTSTTG